MNRLVVNDKATEIFILRSGTGDLALKKNNSGNLPEVELYNELIHFANAPESERQELISPVAPEPAVNGLKSQEVSNERPALATLKLPEFIAEPLPKNDPPKTPAPAIPISRSVPPPVIAAQVQRSDLASGVAKPEPKPVITRPVETVKATPPVLRSDLPRPPSKSTPPAQTQQSQSSPNRCLECGHPSRHDDLICIGCGAFIG